MSDWRLIGFSEPLNLQLIALCEFKVSKITSWLVACRSNWQFASSCETTESGNESGGEGEGKHNKAKITDGTNNFHAVKIINENRNKCFFMYSMKNAYNNCSAILLLCSINVCLAVINWKVTPPFTYHQLHSLGFAPRLIHNIFKTYRVSTKSFGLPARLLSKE